MLESLRLQNYGCIVDATFTLSPLHGLIGPNDSGKSTVLRAIETLAWWATQRALDGHPHMHGFVKLSSKRGPVALEAGLPPESWRIETADGVRFSESLTHVQSGFGPSVFKQQGTARAAQIQSRPAIVEALRGARLLRLEPDELRKASHLIPEGQPIHLAERGTGLPAVYDAILSRDLEAFTKIRAGISQLFPTVKNVRLINVSANQKAMRVELNDGTLVAAEYMSEGLLYYLAFAALPYLEPTAVLLIEEPENGLHPARIKEVMAVLRDLSSRMQVILATHSPLVVNELEAHEVSILTRRSQSEGTRVTLMKDTPDFEERSKVYALGELWVSYANGNDEAPLVVGGARP